jgi:hypothetical protein
MKRRDLILASAGFAGGLIPGFARAAKPCPPPQVSAQGGTTASTTCVMGTPASSYTTDFSRVETPISEGGAWVRLTTSYWHDVKTSGGNAMATANASADRSRFDDSYARLSGSWGPNQQLEATIYKGSALSGEVELNLRCSDTVSTVNLYECTFNIGGQAAIARWNGTAGNFTILADTGSGLQDPGGLEDGDKVRARIVGQTITMWFARRASPTNWVLVGSITDNSSQRITTGSPGIGFFARSPLSLDYGFKDLVATTL